MFNRKHTHTNITTHKQLREKQKQQKQQKYIISQPEPERYLFAVGSWAGYPVVQLFSVCLEAFLLWLLCFAVCFMFLPSLLKLLHFQSKQTHINT